MPGIHNFIHDLLLRERVVNQCVKHAGGTKGSLKIKPLRMLMVATGALEGLLMTSSMPPCYYPAQQG